MLAQDLPMTKNKSLALRIFAAYMSRASKQSMILNMQRRAQQHSAPDCGGSVTGRSFTSNDCYLHPVCSPYFKPYRDAYANMSAVQRFQKVQIHSTFKV